MTTAADLIAETKNEILNHLSDREQWIEQQSIATLDQELEVNAYYWSLGAIGAVAKQISGLKRPFRGNPQKMASFLLTTVIFNLLKTSWDSCLRGYYGVCLTQYRSLNEAELYLQAVQVDLEAANKWLDGTLRDPQATKIVKKHHEFFRTPNLTTNKFVQETGHASEVIGASTATVNAKNQLELHLGPYFDSQKCQYFALLLALNAVPMAGTVIQAFCDVLLDADSWVSEFEAYANTPAPKLQAKLDSLNEYYNLAQTL